MKDSQVKRKLDWTGVDNVGENASGRENVFIIIIIIYFVFILFLFCKAAKSYLENQGSTEYG